MSAYPEIIRMLRGYEDDIIVRLEMASCILGLWSGYDFVPKLSIYSRVPIDVDKLDTSEMGRNFELDIVYDKDCFNKISYVKTDDVYCTSKIQTYREMLDNEKDGDPQALVEALEGYYYCHGDFAGIEKYLDEDQAEVLNGYKEDVVNYSIM